MGRFTSGEVGRFTSACPTLAYLTTQLQCAYDTEILPTSRLVLFSVTAKIKNLQDYYLRLLHGIPLPSELDIACTLKYFSLTLMGKYRKYRRFG